MPLREDKGEETMKIVVDAMGGDFAPKVNVDGAIDALRE